MATPPPPPPILALGHAPDEATRPSNSSRWRLRPTLVLLALLAPGVGGMGTLHPLEMAGSVGLSGALGAQAAQAAPGAPTGGGGLASPLAAQALPPDFLPDPGQGGDPEGGEGPDLEVQCEVIRTHFEMEGWTILRSCIWELCRIHDTTGAPVSWLLGRIWWIEEECDAPGTHEIPTLEGLPFFPPR